MASLQRICEALGVDLPDLLREPGHRSKTPVVRRAERESVRSEWSKASAESLLPNGGDESFSALLIRLDPGGRTGSLPTRKGGRELGYCIRGRVRVTLGSEQHRLSAGDSVLITQTDASWENLGRTRAEVLMVSARLR